MLTGEQGKQTVRRLVTEVINGGHLELIDQLYGPALAEQARTWIGAFRASFPDVHMDIVELIAEPAADAAGEVTVVGRFTCSGTHTGTWRGHPPTGRRFSRIDEVGIYRLTGDRITQFWTLEDTLTRLQQLGLPAAPSDVMERRS